MRDKDGAREAEVWHVVLSFERRDGRWVIAHALGEPFADMAP